MKMVRPITVLTLGPAVVGVAVGCAAWFALPRSPSSILWAVGIGVAGGLVCFGPIAAVLAAKARRPEWFARHSFHLQWYTSILMALALGYLAASIHHQVFDAIGAVCMGVVALGAALKIGLNSGTEDYGRVG